jgi:hypothetical protein
MNSGRGEREMSVGRSQACCEVFGGDGEVRWPDVQIQQSSVERGVDGVVVLVSPEMANVGCTVPDDHCDEGGVEE